MHRVLAALLALLALSAASCGAGGNDADGGDAAGPAASPRLLIEAQDGRVAVMVEIVDTPSERAEGLMGRTSLPPNAGMAFLWREPTRGSFWMKDTLIPLSIAFWDEHGRIAAILDMEPCEQEPCRTYDPGVSYLGAIEVNQGFFREHGIRVGDRVELVGQST